MKKLITLLAIMSFIISASFSFAENGKTADSTSAVKSTSVYPGNSSKMEMMMKCPMMKQQQDIKALLRNILQLQQRGLTASSGEKVKIKEEIAGLIKNIDKMPDKMDCPMMNMKQEDVSSDKKTLPEKQTKEEAKPSEHKH
jgi:hypothetical protein